MESIDSKKIKCVNVRNNKIYTLYFFVQKEEIMELLKLNELTKKKLDETYVVVYAIKNEVNIKKADIIEKNDIYTLIGIDIKGTPTHIEYLRR